MTSNNDLVEQWDATRRAAKRWKQTCRRRSGEGKDAVPEERERCGEQSGDWRELGLWERMAYGTVGVL
ncbi:hypothetical protein AHAS_Ahas07G0143200 [Arachis hypogaea]